MARYKIGNFVRGVLHEAIADSDTTIKLTNVSAPFALPELPPSGRLASLVLMDDPVAPTKIEIIAFSALSAYTPGGSYLQIADVDRGQEGTTPQSWDAGALFVQAVTRDGLEPDPMLHLDIAADRLGVDIDPTTKFQVNGGAKATSFSSPRNALGVVSGAVALDWKADEFITLTLGGATTFSFDINVAVGAEERGVGNLLTLVITNGASNYPITWGSNVRWPGGVVPNHQNGAGKINVFHFTELDGNFYGRSSLDYAP